MYDGASLLGAATVTGTGTTWSYTPTVALTTGLHTLTARVVNAASGLSGAASATYTVNEESLSAISITPHSGVPVLLPAPALVRYVMVRQDNTAAQPMFVGEVQVMVNGVNVALTKPVTMQSSF